MLFSNGMCWVEPFANKGSFVEFWEPWVFQKSHVGELEDIEWIRPYFTREAQHVFRRTQPRTLATNPLKMLVPPLDSWGWNQYGKYPWRLLDFWFAFSVWFLSVPLFSTPQIKVLFPCAGHVLTWALEVEYSNFTKTSYWGTKEGKRTDSADAVWPQKPKQNSPLTHTSWLIPWVTGCTSRYQANAQRPGCRLLAGPWVFETVKCGMLIWCRECRDFWYVKSGDGDITVGEVQICLASVVVLNFSLASAGC